jgi:hypothetical protein
LANTVSASQTVGGLERADMDRATSEHEFPRRKRRWFKYSLRTLFIAMLSFSIAFGLARIALERMTPPLSKPVHGRRADRRAVVLAVGAWQVD